MACLRTGGLKDYARRAHTRTRQAVGAVVERLELRTMLAATVQAATALGDGDVVFTAVNVTDVNEPPTSIILSPSSVAENVPVGTVVGNLSVVDPDIGETYSYEILPPGEPSWFTISGIQLLTAVSLNYEDVDGYSILVRVHDGPNIYDQLLTISVTNVDEPPTEITLSKTSVNENLLVGSVVGILATDDPDYEETHSYEILPGDDAAAFSITGSQLKTAVILDYETKASYSITVRVHDGATTLDQPLTIVVNDVNELPTAIALSNTSVPESQSVGTVVGTFSVTDPDVGETHTYEILPGGDAASFAISGSDLTTAAVFDYEAKSTYSITVRIHDGSNTLDRPVAINVTDLLEFGMLQGKLKTVTIADTDGDLVRFSLAGGGTGTLQPGRLITLAGTTARSALTVKVKKVRGGTGDGLYHVSGITSDGLIKSISGTALVLSGQMLLNTLNQPVGNTSISIKLREISNAEILVQGLPVSSLVVSGDVSDSRIVTSGSIKKLSAWTLLDSEILVGVATSFGGDFAGAAGDFANPAAKLGSLKVVGRKLPSGSAHPAYVTGSHISAPTVGTLTLLNVPASSGAVVHVLNDVGKLKVSQSKLTSETMFGSGTWKIPGTRPVIWDVV